MSEISGKWKCTTSTPMGEQQSTLNLTAENSSLSGTNDTPMGSLKILEGNIDGNTLSWKMQMTAPMKVTLTVTATISGDSIEGEVKAGFFPPSKMVANRITA